MKAWIIGAGIGYVLAYIADQHGWLWILAAWVLTLIALTYFLDYIWPDDDGSC
jgi:hypothetical protein